MTHRLRLFGVAILLAAVAFAAAPALAAGDGESVDALGHTMDNNYLDFAPFGKIELPRLLLVRGGDGSLGLEFYPSTKALLLSGRYVIVDDHVSQIRVEPGEPEGDLADGAGGEAFGAGQPPSHELTVAHQAYTAGQLAEIDYFHATVARAEGAVLVDFSITRHLIFALLAAALLFFLFTSMARRYRAGVGRTEAPRGVLQNMLETVVIYIRDEVARPNIGAKADRYLPYLLTVFFFILTCNLFGLVPYGATATANISVTATLALFTFFITQFAGTKDYWKHIFWPPGVPAFVKPILIPVEFLGLFTKPFALAIRLFANLTAGHLIILNLIGLIFAIRAIFGTGGGIVAAIPSVGLTLFIYLLELLVAFIQAYVFTILSALFIGMAAAEHEHHGHDEHEMDAHDHAVGATAPIVHGNGQPVERKTVGTEEALSPF